MIDFIPITQDTIHEDSRNRFIVEGKMIRDFAIWPKNSHHVLLFNFATGTVTDEDDNEFKLHLGVVFNDAQSDR